MFFVLFFGGLFTPFSVLLPPTLAVYICIGGRAKFAERRCYDFFIRNKRVLGVVLLVLAGSHGFTSNFGQPRLWWFCLLILCMWAIDKRRHFC